MSLVDKFRAGLRRKENRDSVEEVQATPEMTSQAPIPSPSSAMQDPEAARTNPNTDADEITATNTNGIVYDGEKEKPAVDAQNGVRKMQATTLAWTKWSLAGMLVSIWVLFLTNGMRLSILASLTPYVTSSFQSHSLLTVINVVASSMAAACYIPIAKLLDVWGRAEGFLFMVIVSTLGLILMPLSQNLATFCAAQVFYRVGFSGMIYVICVLAADITNLKNRGLAFAFTSSPYMITAFAGSKAAEGFLLNVNWKWGFGCFAIILPFVAAPIFFLLQHNGRKAQKFGLYEKESNGRTFLQGLWHGIVEFDVIGVFLFAGGLTLFLLPFTLAAAAPKGWNTPYIIGMIVTGIVLLALFALHQMYFARSPFLSQEFITDRTVIGACFIDMIYQMSYYCWASYFTSFLQVVNNLSVSNAGYVNSTFQIVSGVLLFIVGYAIRYTGRFKWQFWIAVPLYIFASGLMIHFRRPNQHVGYLIMCEVFISMGGAVFILNMQLAVLAAVDHQHVAAALATLFVSGTIGGAIGSAISGAIWTNTFRGALIRYLPVEELPNVASIYGNIAVQLSYPVGSAARLAIQEAYGYAQTRMLAAGTGIMVLGFVGVALMRDLRVDKISQTKGTVL